MSSASINAVFAFRREQHRLRKRREEILQRRRLRERAGSSGLTGQGILGVKAHDHLSRPARSYGDRRPERVGVQFRRRDEAKPGIRVIDHKTQFLQRHEHRAQDSFAVRGRKRPFLALPGLDRAAGGPKGSCR